MKETKIEIYKMSAFGFALQPIIYRRLKTIDVLQSLSSFIAKSLLQNHSEDFIVFSWFSNCVRQGIEMMSR